MKRIYSPIASPANPYPFLQPITEIAFFDIETTGLSPNASSLYLIGLMRFDAEKGEWVLCQWFADDYHSEKDIIQSFLDALSGITYLYHFNGKTFDIPYLLKKCSRYAITLPAHCETLLNDALGVYSIDLFRKIRPLRRVLSLDKCSQTAVERWLGIRRTDPFSGAELIAVYSEYMQQKIINPENAQKLEQALLLHNHDDVEMLLPLCQLFTYEEYLSDADTNRLLAKDALDTLSVAFPNPEENDFLTVSVMLPIAVPKKITITAPYPIPAKSLTDSLAVQTKFPAASLTFQGNTASFVFPVYRGILKFFFPNYKDYYYLPKEDTAIHKSVAAFVDRDFRKKATAATGYTKKEGRFLPNLPPAKRTKQEGLNPNPALLYFQYRDKLSFCELPTDFAANQGFWKEYIKRQLPYFCKGTQAPI